MTHEQYDTLVRLMRGNPQTAASRAARLVLVEGVTQADAMRETGASRSTISLTVRRFSDADAQIRKAYLPD